MLKDFVRQHSNRLYDQLKVADLAHSIVDIDAWAKQDFGCYLLRQQQRILQQKYTKLPGYRLMHLGLFPHSQTIVGFEHLHSFHIAPSHLVASGSSVVSNYSEIPLPSGVIDVAILQHAVEYSASPQAVLAEISRVVAPGGHILLFLFNPLGPRGLIKFPMQLVTGRTEYCFHSLRKGRVIDWLSLLNFQVLEIEHGAYNLPLNYQPWLEQDSRWEKLAQKIRFPLGNFYMIHAVKRELRGITKRAHSWRPAANSGYSSSSRKISRKNIKK